MTATTHPSITENIKAVRDRVAAACERVRRPPSSVTLIGVSKTVEPEHVVAALEAGLTDLGENRVQEGAAKQTTLATLGFHPTWHLIGHLQTNKVRTALEHFACIHSVDSVRLLDSLESRAPRVIDLFIEVNVAGEETKTGIAPGELPRLLEHASPLKQLNIRGLMTIAPLTASDRDLHAHFAALRELAERYQLRDLSMGMTNDFEIAIEEGATHVRVGRAIFGERA